MHEHVLAAFFTGQATAADVSGSTKQVNEIESHIEIEDMAEEFAVTSAMAVALCDAVLSGDLPAEALATIGFALIASDKFVWDGDENEVLAEVIAEWPAPEINLPLTPENVRKFRRWLTGTESYPAKPARDSGIPRLVSLRKKVQR